MKNLRLPFFFLLCIGLLGWAGCGDDEDDALIIESLNYDGPPVSAPNIDANMFAVYFPPSELSQYTNRDIETVTFALQNIPPTVKVVIWDAALTDSGPADMDNIEYELDITNRINATTGDLMPHRLASPVDLSNRPNGIWIGIETDIAEGNRVQSIRCDAPGNGNPNGQWVRIGNDWVTFTALGGEDVNWNIRGLLSEAE